MSSSSENRSPLARLVLFMIILSVAGSFAAGAHYYAIDLPEQKVHSGLTPTNTANMDTAEKCNTCKSGCSYRPESEYYQCMSDCEVIC